MYECFDKWFVNKKKLYKKKKKPANQSQWCDKLIKYQNKYIRISHNFALHEQSPVTDLFSIRQLLMFSFYSKQMLFFVCKSKKQ